MTGERTSGAGPAADDPAVVLRTGHHQDFTVGSLVARKRDLGLTTALVLPARNEEATVASVVEAFIPLRDAGLLDDVLVLDSLSTDGTPEVARAAGARVVPAADAVPEVEAIRGKGEAMWRALHVTDADLIAFCDADVLDAGPHYAVGLLGPLLHESTVQLVKGFYRRPIVGSEGEVEEHGGRVTELTARPLLNLYRPDLAQLVQPLAGEWAGRRRLLESLPFPTGYGVEIGVLLDTHALLGLEVLAQVDLGCRTHRHQSQQALGVMAAEVMGTALRRLGLEPAGHGVAQFSPEAHAVRHTAVPLLERRPRRPRER